MAEIIKTEGSEITIQVKVNLKGSMLEIENSILDAVNETGQVATQAGLKRFDTDGSPLCIGDTRLTSKGLVNKTYETPYGAVSIERNIYQTSKGGKTYCPLEQEARIIQNATPKFSQQVSSKYCWLNAPPVCQDLADNHARCISQSYVQKVSDYVASIAAAKEEVWEYETPQLDKAIETIVFSLDGAFVPLRASNESDGETGGYREAMVGNISLYDIDGERQHTIYIGAAPEYGKGQFFKRFTQEIEHIKKQYPDATYIGIADGAKSNWSFLSQHTDNQLLDFFHVTEYISKVSHVFYPEQMQQAEREKWLHEQCHNLKHVSGTVVKIIEDIHQFLKSNKLTKSLQEDVLSALSYFENNQGLMDYSNYVKKKLPIGSGVTEAACKTLVKQRLCCSGMRWKMQGVKCVLSLRALLQSKGRWQQFWERIEQFGACLA